MRYHDGGGLTAAEQGHRERVRPAAAVTGTYFGLRDAQPVGDIVIGGRLVNSGFVGTALAITGKNRVRFVETRRWKARWC